MDSRVTVVVVFVLSVVVARALSVPFPSVPPEGLSLAPRPAVPAFTGGVYGGDTAVVAVTVVQYVGYAVVSVTALVSALAAGLGVSSTAEQARNGYVLMTLLVGIPALPVVLVGVFGLELLGATLVSPFLPAGVDRNFAVLSAPLFLLALVVGTVTVEIARQFDEDRDRAG